MWLTAKRECLGRPKFACALLKSLFLFQLLVVTAEITCLLTPSARLGSKTGQPFPVKLLCSMDYIACVVCSETYLLKIPRIKCWNFMASAIFPPVWSSGKNKLLLGVEV